MCTVCSEERITQSDFQWKSAGSGYFRGHFLLCKPGIAICLMSFLVYINKRLCKRMGFGNYKSFLILIFVFLLVSVVRLLGRWGFAAETARLPKRGQNAWTLQLHWGLRQKHSEHPRSNGKGTYTVRMAYRLMPTCHYCSRNSQWSKGWSEWCSGMEKRDSGRAQDKQGLWKMT